MATRPGISQTNSSAEMDMISNLPKELREKILIYLPIEDAGRISSLSSTWRQTWNSIPDLVIHCDSNGKFSKTVKSVDESLALHDNGPICKFDLRAEVHSEYAFDKWICNLSKNKIKELSLDMLYFNPDPSSFFSFHYLSFLCLKDFYIELPVRLGSLKFLRTLELLSIRIYEDDLKKLISCCPVLENLTIHEYHSVSQVGPRISAPNLRKFCISGWFHFIELCAPKLLTLCLDFKHVSIWRNRSSVNFSGIDLNKLFIGLPNLQILELKTEFLYNFLDKEIVEGEFILQNLKELSLDFLGLVDEQPKFLPALFQNAPNLQVLHLERLSGSMNGQDFSFQNLQIMNMIVSECTDNVLPFMNSMLGSVSKLRKLIIKIIMHCCDEKPECLDEICLKKRVLSLTDPTKAQIIFEEN